MSVLQLTLVIKFFKKVAKLRLYVRMDGGGKQQNVPEATEVGEDMILCVRNISYFLGSATLRAPLST